MRDLSQEQIQAAKNLILPANKILLVSHHRPDGDSLGAVCALHLALKQLGKQTTLACIDEIPHRLKFIPGTDFFVKEFNMFDFDLIIICDAGAHHMTGFHEKYPDFLSKKIPILNIDHHASNENFGTVNIVDSQTCSTTAILWKLFKHLPVQPTKEIALALLAGIYNDTGGLIHANTNQETFEIVSELVMHNIDVVVEIVRPMFKESTMAQLRLWGFILENMRLNEKNVAASVVTEEDFKKIGAHASDTGGIVDLMNTVPEARFAMLLAEDEGCVKGSMRTQRDDVDLSEIAGHFGGGGHKKASGFRVHGRLQKQIIWKIVPIDL